MPELIDLSQEIFTGMPVYPGLPEVRVAVAVTHEDWAGDPGAETRTPAVNRLDLGEHTGTHVDAFNHMAPEYRGWSIETMPLSMFYTRGLCLDLAHKGLRALIEPDDLERALAAAGGEIAPGDTVLLYTDHYRRAYQTDEWQHGPGLSVAAAPNLINLHLLIGRGPFCFIGLPLRIRGGTGSPVRAVAVFEA
jgi:kynurenine formamidase